MQAGWSTVELLEGAAKVAAALTAIGALAGGLWKRWLGPYVRRSAKHRAAMRALPEIVHRIDAELRPNGGKSFRDELNAFREYSSRRFDRIDDRFTSQDAFSQALAAQSDHPMFRSDAQGRFAYISEAWTDITGQSAADASGWGWVNGVHPEDRDRVLNEWRAAIEQSRIFIAVFTLWCLDDGTRTRVRCEAHPSLSEGGRMLGYVGVIKLQPIARVSSALRVSESSDAVPLPSELVTPRKAVR